MSKKEVINRLSQYRGVNDLMFFGPNEKVAAIEPKIIGLVDRDFILNEKERFSLYNAVETIIKQRKHGLYLSEMRLALIEIGLSLPHKLSDYMIMSLCKIDPRFKAGRGQYIYLSSWPGPRRKTVLEALRIAVKELDFPTTLDAITERVERIMAHPLSNRNSLYNQLRELGLIYNNQTHQWEKIK